MNKPKSSISILLVLILFVSGFVIIGGIFMYFVFHPDDTAIQNQKLKKYINKKADVIGHSIYLRTLQEPDKDNDGLSDLVEENIYKTDPNKYNSNGTSLSDGQYVYSVYYDAFSANKENKLALYRKNVDAYLMSLNIPTSTPDLLGIMSLNEAFRLRSNETYDFYVGIPADLLETLRQAEHFRDTNEFDKSLQLIQDAIAKDPTSSVLKFHLGEIYQVMNDLDKALLIYTSLLDDSVIKSPKFYTNLAYISNQKEDLESVVKYLELSIKEFPEDLYQYLDLARYYEAKYEFEKAKDVLNRGLLVEPRYASFYNELAIIAGEAGDNKTEVDLYKKAISYDFLYEPGHSNLALLYGQYLGKHDEALIEARIAWELEQTTTNLGQLVLRYYEAGNATKAKEYEAQLLRRTDIDSLSLNSLGLMYLEKQNFKEAEMYFRKVVSMSPEFPNAYNNLGIVLSSTGRNPEALINYKKAIELDPRYENAYNNLGVYYRDKKEYTEAIKNFQMSIKFNPNNINANVNLGYTYILLNDKTDARIYYQKAVDLGSTDPTVLQNLKILNQ